MSEASPQEPRQRIEPAATAVGPRWDAAVLNLALLNVVAVVTDEQAFAAARRLEREEGILAGVSSAAALHVALTMAADDRHADQRIVVLLPDGGERYLSSALFAASSASVPDG